jgi:predicted DNA-binding protein
MKWIRLTISEELINNLKLLAKSKTTSMSKLIRIFITNQIDFKDKEELNINREANNTKTLAFELEEEQEDKLISLGKKFGISKNIVLIKIIENNLESVDLKNIEEDKEEVIAFSVRLLKSELKAFKEKVKESEFNKNEIIREYLNKDFNIKDLKHTRNRVTFNSKVIIYLYQKQKDILETNSLFFSNSNSDLLRAIIQHITNQKN